MDKLHIRPDKKVAMKKYFWWPLAAISFVSVLVFFVIALATLPNTLWWKLLAVALVVNFIAGLATYDENE